ncbi:MAG: hypothetical protein H0U67_16840 [Gemmatimonadetes bacterium]|nr:hypothetical protein [Gemmatimonadota bacterium]
MGARRRGADDPAGGGSAGRLTPLPDEAARVGEIPFHRVGVHCRVYRSEVEAYRRTQAARARQAMLEMAEQAKRLGLYD